MLPDVVAVKPVEGRRLWVRFDDGVEGEVDIAGLLQFDGVFAALRDPQVFASVRLYSELGTVVWPNGADIDPVVLYENLRPTKRVK